MKVLNLHGYHASAENSVCRALRKHGYDVVSPEIDYDAQSPKEILTTLLNLYVSENCEAVAGSSMGGFFAIQAAAVKQCPAVLINPCLHAWEMDFINRDFALEYVELFSNLSKLNLEKTFAIIGEKDDVIKSHDFVKYLLGLEHCVLIPNGGHPGSSLPLDEIFEDYGEEFFAINSEDC